MLDIVLEGAKRAGESYVAFFSCNIDYPELYWKIGTNGSIGPVSNKDKVSAFLAEGKDAMEIVVTCSRNQDELDNNSSDKKHKSRYLLTKSNLETYLATNQV